MFRRVLPIVLVAIALSVVFGVLFATMRLGRVHPTRAWFSKRPTDPPVEPEKEAQPL